MSDINRATPRYLAPIISGASAHHHLLAACQLAVREHGTVLGLVIGLVPHSLPMGSDVPELWSRLEYEAARARRQGRQLGCEVETVLVLSDSAGEAVVQLAEECEAGAVCLAYEQGPWATFRRWRDPLWRTVLERSPRPVILERISPARDEPATPKLPKSAALARRIDSAP